jgi:hypothetical protein
MFSQDSKGQWALVVRLPDGCLYIWIKRIKYRTDAPVRESASQLRPHLGGANRALPECF